MERAPLRLIASLCIALAVAPAWAQVTPPEEYDKTVTSAEAVGALGPALFGDETNLYTGATTFTATDVSLPGNDALPVSIGRRFIVRSRSASERNDLLTRDGGFADWELDIPHLHGVFAKGRGWQVDGWNEAGKDQRCSLAAANSAEAPSVPGTPYGATWEGFRYWSGNTLYVPGIGDQEMLVVDAAANPHQPTDGAQYRWVTSGQWYFSCLPATSNGVPGEAFLGLAPDGTRYRFDWFAHRHAPVVTRATGSPMANALVPANPATTTLAREEVWILPTRIEDRFGNAVTYTYDPQHPWRLQSIAASDGRRLTLGYSGGQIATVSDGTRTWRYVYDKGLTGVVLPDQSRWTIDFAQLRNAYTKPGNAATKRCSEQAASSQQDTYTGTLTHPSGAKGEFAFRSQMHGRSYVPRVCPPDHGGAGEGFQAFHPFYFETVGILSKTITGPALDAPMRWTHVFGPVHRSWDCPGETCPSTKVLEVTGPGEYRRYTFGTRFRESEGKLLKVETGSGPADILRTEVSTYQLDPAGQAYPSRIGRSPYERGDQAGTRIEPLTRRVTTQQGRDFTWQVDAACGSGTQLCFDGFGRATRTTAASESFTRTDVVTFEDQRARWVLGLPKTSTNLDTGLVASRTDYDPVTALPVADYAFGKLQRRATYHADGTLATVSDGRDAPAFDTSIAYSGWMRGIPQRVDYPDGTFRSAKVGSLGQLEWVEDEIGYRTCYRHDAMGRLAQVTYPSETLHTCDESQWNARHRSFAPSATADFGLPIGHWKDTAYTGTGFTVTHYDGLWRPVVTERFDAADKTGTWRQAVTRYAPQGGVAFASSPAAGITHYAAAATGTRTHYDALGRPVRVEQDSEHGPLVTRHEYLAGFLSRVTAPGGYATTRSYQAFDTPTMDTVRGIAHPEGAFTDIVRDVFGKPVHVSRRNADWSIAITRSYTYNAHQELCRRYEPETAATLMGYDDAGNLAWSASGLPWGTPCELDGTSATVLARKSTRAHDQRNRLTSLAFADGIGEQAWTYTADGLPKAVWTYNGVGRTELTYNAYQYNSRRMLAGPGELLHQPGWTWSLGYGYDRNGYLGSLTYPDGSHYDFTVDALGQTTKITGTSGTYVSDAAYHPNGALRRFTYGNGLVHTLEQNTRGLPLRSRVADSEHAVLDDSFDYDFNGNVAAISDGLTSARSDRSMTYDGLDRLVSATSSMFGGTLQYSYDVLDNIQTQVGPDRNVRNCYDGANRLAFVRADATDCSTGAATTSLGFDVQGNLRFKNAQAHAFSQDNRLRSVAGKEAYRYDAHGRRVTSDHAALGTIRSFYGRDGTLAFQVDGRTGKNRAYIHLAGTLVATREQPSAGGEAVLTFHHADVLGTPVAVTDRHGNVVERSEYEPYGVVRNRPIRDGPGYTGHVEDAQTGLVYMQQRLYDPETQRFLSVDPVAADTATGWNFNRYNYAANNPYKYKDPDGRAIETPWDAVNVGLGVASLLGNARAGNWVAAGVDGLGVLLDGAAAAIPGVPGGVATAIRVARGVDAAADAARASDATRIADDALVVRGGAADGANSAKGLARGTVPHPAGPIGFSAESANGASLCQLCANVAHNQVGVTTAGQVRAAGGDVVSTFGKSTTHATVTGLSPEAASTLLTPTQANPVPKGQRRLFDH